MSEITLGVAIITKNRIDQLKKLLPQLSKFDQVVVVDTGSIDGTEKYVRGLGKPFEYHTFAWRPKPRKGMGSNDWGFAAARNASFSYLKTTHAIWLDTDDLIGMMKSNREFIASADQTYNAFMKVATEAPEEVDVWFVNYIYSRDADNNPNVVHSRERMVKLSTNWSWVYPIHECLVPDKKPTHAMISDIQTIHYANHGSESTSERNMLMLKLWLAQLEAEGNHHDLARCRLLIGNTYWGMQKWKESARYLVNEFIAKHPEALDIEKWQAWGFVCRSQMELENFEAAGAAALACIDIEPTYGDGYLLLAQVKMATDQDPQDILHLIDFSARCDTPPSQVITNPLDSTFTPYCIVSSCKFKLEQYETALDFALKAQAILPRDGRAEMLRAQAADMIRRRDAKAAAKALYQLYVDYDENLKASKLYEILPYVAQEDDEIIDIAELAATRVRHMTNREDYVKLYTENTHWTPASEDSIDNPHEYAGAERFEYILDRLKKALPNGGRILDVGCSDGFHSLQYARAGFEVVGLDLDHRCVTLANKRAEDRGLSAKFVFGFFEVMDPAKVKDPFDPSKTWFENFDAVVCSEVIEHVQDPDILLGSLADCAKPGAPVILTTPDGAFDKGDIPTGGGMHEEDKNMSGHVRVFTQQTFEHTLKKDPAFHVTESHFLPFSAAYRKDQGWQVGEIVKAPRPDGPVIRIYCGKNIDFTPADLDKGGIGGSETAVIHMAKAWADRGCQVVVYGGVQGIFDGVFYRLAEHFNPKHKSDVFISWRLPTAFQEERPNAELTVLWCHDLYYPVTLKGYAKDQFPDEWIDRIDKIVVLSKFHQKSIEALHKNFKGKTWVTRNGIDGHRYTSSTIAKTPHRYFYSSSYDRGLEELIAVWPEIKKEIPDAELHVAYGTQTAEAILRGTGQQDQLNRMRKMVAKMQSLDGVVHHERLGQKELAELQMSCEAWLYPYQPDHESGAGGFLETYCITALEAQAAGCVPITRLNGALKETVHHCHEWGKDTTTEHIIEILKNEDLMFPKGLLEANKKMALELTWESLSEEWLREFAPKELAEVK